MDFTFDAAQGDIRALARTILAQRATPARLVAAFGASIVAFGLAPSWPLALGAIVVVGACYFSAMTTLNTLLQYLVEEEMRGRISSLFVMGWAGLVPIGGLWQGVAAGARGVRFTFTVAGSVTCVYALLVLSFRRRWIHDAVPKTEAAA
jgi:hypothetical protein